jgi:hypothetical protein
MGPTGPEEQPELTPEQQISQWDVNVIATDDGEDQPWVIIMEKFVQTTFREWVKSAGLHESRENDVLYLPSDNPRSLLKGNERNRVIRAANIALGDAYK